MADNLQKVYGIDLGTTYSCIAVVDETGNPAVILNDDSEPITPSVVLFDEGKVIVGKVAKESAVVHPNSVVEMVKRSMGDENYAFENDGTTYSPEEISAFILRKLIADAEQQTGEKPTDVVITVPAWFGVNQREATANAGKIAGLNVRSIISEPTAAAICYGMQKADDQVVLVYDLGGGTFDITMIEVKQGQITVLCTGGNHQLGGKDWDGVIVTYLADQYRDESGSSEDILDDSETYQDLLTRAEAAKKTLSKRDATTIRVSHAGESPKIELTRQKFNELTSHLLEQTVTLTHEMLDIAKKKGYERFDRILLVGGSTRMPQVAERIGDEFGVPTEMYDPDQAVAKGAAIYGWMLSLGEEIKLAIADKTGQDADAVEVAETDEQIIKDAQEEIAQKFGLPAPLVKKATDTEPNEITSKTFGIVAEDENHALKVFNLILRNDRVPADVSNRFGTVEDNQTQVEIRLMESLEFDKVTALDTASEIGQAELTVPSGLPAGSPIDVKFQLNKQGRLEVSATEPTSNQTININVETGSIMSEEQVEKARSRGLAIPVES